jgi:glutaredoxin-like protein NrdH
MASTRVTGTNKGNILVYALSTCGWCMKTKNLLNDLGVEYCYVDVDRTDGEEREALIGELKSWNPSLSFPTVVVNGEKCIVGFKEEDIREVLAL